MALAPIRLGGGEGAPDGQLRRVARRGEVGRALRRALDSAGEEQRAAAKALIDGVELTLRELISVFTRHGMEPIMPQVGDRFDPQNHQAMFEAPLPGTKAGDIIQVMTEGFMLHERLLRPAQVGVSSTPKS